MKNHAQASGGMPDCSSTLLDNEGLVNSLSSVRVYNTLVLAYITMNAFDLLVEKQCCSQTLEENNVVFPISEHLYIYPKLLKCIVEASATRRLCQ